MVQDNMDWLDEPDYEYCEAELAAEQEWENFDPDEDDEEGYKYLNSLTTWETKDLQVLKISEMKTSHIKNCIKKIIRDEWRGEYLWSLTKELIKRKEL